jgi:hypothetical protein
VPEHSCFHIVVVLASLAMFEFSGAALLIPLIDVVALGALSALSASESHNNTLARFWSVAQDYLFHFLC